MRYGTEAALLEVQVRGRNIRRRSECKKTLGLSTAVACLSVLLVMSGSLLMPNLSTFLSQSSYGAYLLSGEAGGYVLMGVMAFVAGACITLICLRAKARADEKQSYEDSRSDNLLDGVEREHDHV